nr:iron-containing alcohol dehydrogenase [Photorhabdus australis]
MQNFEYYNPTKIVFGKETIGCLDGLVPQDARVLILYGDGSTEKTGTLDEVKNTLASRAIQEFGGIEPYCSYSQFLRKSGGSDLPVGLQPRY